MKRFTTFLNIVATFAIFIILPIAVVTLATSKMEMLGVRSFTVLTGSMEPALPVGSIVYTFDKSLYEKGEIIAFHRGDIVITHRILNYGIKNHQRLFLTKGDANNVIDQGYISANNIIGTVWFSIPYVGRAFQFFATPLGYVLFIVLPTIVFVCIEFYNIKKEIEKQIMNRYFSRVTDV